MSIPSLPDGDAVVTDTGVLPTLPVAVAQTQVGVTVPSTVVGVVTSTVEGVTATATVVVGVTVTATEPVGVVVASPTEPEGVSEVASTVVNNTGAVVRMAVALLKPPPR